MSSAGQAVGGVVGAVAGFFVGGPSGALYGAQLGMMAGGLIDPPKGPNITGPRLDDLKVQTSTYGAPIPRLYGTIATAGNIFWLENNSLKEVAKKKKSGGKGGPSTTTTTFSYYATFALGLCDCSDGSPIAGVRRIWCGPDLIYDVGSSDIGAIIASNEAASFFTLHDGSLTQLPDDRMQATLGVSNTPAYRGLAYIVFNDFPLEKHSNSLMAAQFKVEVVKSGIVTKYQATEHSLPSSQLWKSVAWSNGKFCAVARGGACALSSDGIIWLQGTLPTSENWSSVCGGDNGFCAIARSSVSSAFSRDGKTWILGALPAAYTWTDVKWTGSTFIALSENGKVSLSKNGISWSLESSISYGTWYRIVWNGSVFLTVSFSSDICSISTDGIIWTDYPMPSVGGGWSCVAWNKSGSFFCALKKGSNIGAISHDGKTWIQVVLPLTANWFGIESVGAYLYAYANNLSINPIVSSDGINWEITTLPGSATWWDIEWNGGILCAISYNSAISATVRPYVLSITSITLSSIIQSECLSSNLLAASDIDAIALAQPVRGYRVSTVAAIRGAIDPLQAAWPFDVIQSGYKIVFKPRGSSSVVTIPADDLDARGSGDQSGISITNAREMDSVLPRRLVCNYLDADREYDTGSQVDERLNTDAANTKIIEMSIVLTASECLGIVQTLLYMYWMERYAISFTLPSKYNQIEAGDVVTITADESIYSLRLTSITYTQDNRLECSARYANAAIYVHAAQAETGQSSGQVLTISGPSATVLLDIPLLLDTLDGPGFVVAMAGYMAGWPGGQLLRSDDQGQSWDSLQVFAKPGATIGSANNAIGSSQGGMIDKSSALLVGMIRGDLSSVTELAMLSGANYFAYGKHGRWEIIAAQNCTLQADGTYILTDILRGQQGTEWAGGLHAVGDEVILLDSDLAFVSVNLNSIGQSRLYRGVTNGALVESASDKEFTYSGVNLECLSPCYLNGNRNAANDWELTWIRRTRVGGALRDYVDASLGEASEAYEVEIYSSNTYATLKRTITGLTTPAAAYTSAQQVTDFGSNQSTLYIKIYQLSANVGRGYPLITSITR